MKKKQIVMLMVVILALVMGTAVVHAITIVVDGVKETEWDGSGGQTPGIILDTTNESDIDDRYDIKEVRYTNDSTGGTAPYGFMYWLFETYANYDSNYPSNDPLIIICLDTDGNTSTGGNAVGYCDDMTGIERRVRIKPTDGTVQVQGWNGSGFFTISQPTGGLRSVAFFDSGSDGIADYPYIEAGFDLESLGITNSATCISTMHAAVYFDNGIIDGEDQVPNSGTAIISCGTPTAVSLQSFSAGPGSSLPVYGVIGFAALVMVGLVALALRRERKQA